MLGGKPDHPESPVAVIARIDQVFNTFLVARLASPFSALSLAEHVDRSIGPEVVFPQRENHVRPSGDRALQDHRGLRAFAPKTANASLSVIFRDIALTSLPPGLMAACTCTGYAVKAHEFSN